MYNYIHICSICTYTLVYYLLYTYICDKLTTSSSNNIINLPTKINSQIVQSKTTPWHVGGKAMIKHGTNIVYGQ